ncbi:HAD-IIIA family hydrolase [Tardiphaga sp. vice304]|uniref:HAD-IIIA family hydrolase n=1 Tax=Tardiphaga sp. vice304 TaxID=2592817 RepID=UPI001163D3D8|nr:HAD-IIIA family hydrolase [Tardiphaga sp. vice304]QDM28175.1 HAD-IIIA family hydrolase [Tardiphaga sp. vice304]
MKQAVILAGGKGTRLADRLGGLPKPLIDVDGIPLLQRQIELLKDQGFRNVLVLVNHRAELIEQFLAEQQRFGIDITCIDDGEPRGTAGAVHAVIGMLQPEFLVVYGDTLFDVDLNRLWENHIGSGAEATLLLHPNDHPHDSDLVVINDDNSIARFIPYPHTDGEFHRNLVNAALYVINRRIFSQQPKDGILDFGRDFFPGCLKAGIALNGYVSPEYIKDIGTPSRLDRAISDLRRGVIERASLARKQKAVFLDRDGTLNVLNGYVRTPDDLELVPGAGRALNMFRSAEFRSIVVTNQPVIARGECSVRELNRIHAKMDTLLGAAGAFVDGLYFCPHHPDAGFEGEVSNLKVACDCRKPAIGMIERARKDFNIDLSSSWMVGDSSGDMRAARNAGVRAVLVRTGEAGNDGKFVVSPDYEFADIGEAARFITGGYHSLKSSLEEVLEGIRSGMLVRVVGRARVGKSTVAQLIVDELRSRGFSAERVGLDGFIRPLDERTDDGVVGRFDVDLARSLLDPWLRGGALLDAKMPVYLRNKRVRAGESESVTLASDAIVVVEGVVAGLIEPVSRAELLVGVTDGEARRHDRFVQEYRARSWSDDVIEKVYNERIADESWLTDSWVAQASHVVDMQSILGKELL